MEEKSISRIKLQNNEVYDIKDALLRHQINVLLGIEQPDERDRLDSEDNE